MGVSRVFWDTNLFVYLVEDRGERAERVSTLRRRMIERDDELLTSALTLGEVLVKPKEAGGRGPDAPLRAGDRGGRNGTAFRLARRSQDSRKSAGTGRFGRRTPSSLPVHRQRARTCSSPTTNG